MTSSLLKFALAAGSVVALSACASLAPPAPDARFAQIHPGLTQDDVRELAGAPLYVGSNSRTNETLWTYASTDEFGEPYEFGVDFDQATGLVAETSRLRTRD
jgi:hypothetical protein